MEDVERWAAAGQTVALGTVVGVRKSAPRPPGAKMAISSGGEVSGQVSGGCVEGAVVEAAMEVIAGGEPRVMRFGISDDEAWSVGLPCGGEIDVWVSGAPHPGFASLARAGGRGALVTRLDDASALFVPVDGAAQGTLGSEALDAAALAAAAELSWGDRSERRELEGGVSVFVDVTSPPPRVIAFGAVDIAGSLCRIAQALGWRSYVVDPRGFFARPERFAAADEVVTGWPEEAFARIGGIDRATSIVVLTHDPKLDDAALAIALRSEAEYVGAMGSRRAQEARRERLLGLGFTEDELARLAAPVGLDLGALTPEETAISVMAEIVALRRGRDGGRLKHASGRIHEVEA